MAIHRDRYLATTFGFSTGEWEVTRDWVAKRLHRVARDRSKITYGELCREMSRSGVLALEPHSSPLAGLLGQINLLEHEAGRPLISALVVHQDGDMLPGTGFWTFVRDVGIDPELARRRASCLGREKFSAVRTIGARGREPTPVDANRDRIPWPRHGSRRTHRDDLIESDP